MGQPSSKDEMTIRHQFDRLCQMALKGEAVNYYKHMDYRRKHEVTFSELSEKELSKLFTMDEYGTEYHHFEVHGYDIEVKNTLIAEALKELTERKRNVILLSYFMEMSDADIAREMNLVRSTIHEHRTRSLEILKKIMEGIADEKDFSENIDMCDGAWTGTDRKYSGHSESGKYRCRYLLCSTLSDVWLGTWRC